MLDKKHYALIGTTIFFSLTSAFAGYKYIIAYQNVQRIHHRANIRKMMSATNKHRRQRPNKSDNEHWKNSQIEEPEFNHRRHVNRPNQYK